MENDSTRNTQEQKYTDDLIQLQHKWWKRLLDVQAPYRWNLNRLQPGLTLDVGCGIGRNLSNLKGKGVGVDHNEFSVEAAKKLGWKAFVPEDFWKSEYSKPATFDSILLSHILEHMSEAESVECIRGYLPVLKPAGKLIITCPQEKGFRRDPTHVEFMDFPKIERVMSALGFKALMKYSFPFPRPIGHLFVYNEFVVVGRREA